MVLFNLRNAAEVTQYRKAYVQAAHTCLESSKAFCANDKDS